MSDQHERRRTGTGRRLSDRQAALLGFIGDGRSNREIADRLGLAEQTVKEQVSSLFRQLAVRNRAHLASLAVELRLFGTPLDAAAQQALFTEAQFGLVVTRGVEHRIEAANHYVLAMFPNRAVIGLTVRDAFPWLAASALAALDRTYGSAVPLVAHEYAFSTVTAGIDEREKYVDFVVQPLFGPNGLVTGLQIMYLDVTREVVARRELEDLAVQHLGELDQLSQGVIVLDRTGRVVRVSEAVKRHGFAVHEGADLWAHLAPLESELGSGGSRDSAKEFARVLSGDAVPTRDFLIRAEQALGGRARASLTPLHDSGGQLRGGALIYDWAPEASATVG